MRCGNNRCGTVITGYWLVINWNNGITELNLFDSVTQKQDGKKIKNENRASEMHMIHYSSQGEMCIMGMKRIFQKLKANARCVRARDQYKSQMSDSCPCTEADFEWWVPCTAATSFSSVNPLHFISLQSQSLWSHLKPNKRTLWRLTYYNSQHYVFYLNADLNDLKPDIFNPEISI